MRAARGGRIDLAHAVGAFAGRGRRGRRFGLLELVDQLDEEEEPATVDPKQQKLRVSIEKKGRGGKITAIKFIIEKNDNYVSDDGSGTK